MHSWKLHSYITVSASEDITWKCVFKLFVKYPLLVSFC